MKNTIKELLDNFDGDTINGFFYSEYDSSYYGEQEDKDALSNAGIEIENVDNHGGEGEGEDYWSVYKFTKGDDTVYVKFQGWYQSYNGAEFNEWFFVEPKEKVITVYEA